MNNIEDRVYGLPKWAQQYIKELKEAAKSNALESSPLQKKIESLEESNRRLKDRVDLMTEIFQCGAKGGSEIAKAAVEKLASLYGEN